MRKKYSAAVITAAFIAAALTGCSDNFEGGEGTTAPVTPELTATVAAESTTAPAAATAAQTEADTTLNDDEFIAKLKEISGYVTGKFSKATLNRIYDEKSIQVSATIEKNPSLLIRVKEAGDIPGAAFEASEIYREALAAAGFTSGILSVNTYEKDDKGNLIDETMIAWRSPDGLTGNLVDGVDVKRVEDCTIDGLYEYFGDKVKPFTAEETVDFIKKRINKKSEGLLHEDDKAVSVATAGGSIAVSVRTYEEFLIPAAAEYAYEVIIPIAERSELPFSRIVSTVYENDENGGIKQETMIGWTTMDGKTGTFNSHPEPITDGEYTLNELYVKYGEYTKLIEKAKNNERVQKDN